MSILTKAEELINGDRAKAYGCPLKMGRRIGLIWESILGIKVSPEQVNLCMLGLKIAREVNRHNQDNLVDMAGYAGVLEKIVGARLREEDSHADNKTTTMQSCDGDCEHECNECEKGECDFE